MCWRVPLPVDSNAETGPSPPQHMGMHSPWGGTIPSQRGRPVSSRNGHGSHGSRDNAVPLAPVAVSHLPPFPRRPAPFLAVAHSPHLAVVFVRCWRVNRRPWTGTGSAASAWVKKKPPVSADPSIVRWQNGEPAKTNLLAPQTTGPRGKDLKILRYLEIGAGSASRGSKVVTSRELPHGGKPRGTWLGCRSRRLEADKWTRACPPRFL